MDKCYVTLVELHSKYTQHGAVSASALTASHQHACRPVSGGSRLGCRHRQRPHAEGQPILLPGKGFPCRHRRDDPRGLESESSCTNIPSSNSSARIEANDAPTARFDFTIALHNALHSA